MEVKDIVRDRLFGLLYALTGPGQGVHVILLYHSIGSDAPNSLPLDIFEQQMRMLARHFKPIRLRDLPATMASAPANINFACVTFDDGYWDNYKHALPILEQLGIKATFFIATGFLGSSFPTYAGLLPMMTSRDVRALAALGHEIGAHTMTHPGLTTVSLETARAEVESSKHLLEDLLQSELISFAYPKGKYNKSLETLVGALGFKLAVTTRERLVSENPDWLALPRIGIIGRPSMREFAARASPAINWYAQLRGRD